MHRLLVWISLISAFLLGTLAASAHAGSPNWRLFVPFAAQVEYDARKSYTLHDGNGPWMILAATFSGEGGADQARLLVKELRTRFNLQAYVHRQVYDFSETVEGKGFARESRSPLKMRYYKNGKSEQYAVLVGNFDSVDNPEVQQTLNKIKYARPQTLKIDKDKGTRQQLAIMRTVQRLISPDPNRKKMGPMSAAFVTRNPILPKEFFAPKGMDSFVYNLNKDNQFSLLKNPKPFTVRVASFRGTSTMNIGLGQQKGVSNKLVEAAEKAHLLVEALRRKGVEAYEFHDRHESIVTIGGFDRIGDKMPNGQIELLPGIHRIMTAYGATKKRQQNGQIGMYPKALKGIIFDVQPWPVEVPRASIARDYNRRLSYSR